MPHPTVFLLDGFEWSRGILFFGKRAFSNTSIPSVYIGKGTNHEKMIRIMDYELAVPQRIALRIADFVLKINPDH